MTPRPFLHTLSLGGDLTPPRHLSPFDEAIQRLSPSPVTERGHSSPAHRHPSSPSHPHYRDDKLNHEWRGPLSPQRWMKAYSTPPIVAWWCFMSPGAVKKINNNNWLKLLNWNELTQTCSKLLPPDTQSEMSHNSKPQSKMSRNSFSRFICGNLD